MARFMYSGELPQAFSGAGFEAGVIEPGGEFEVPDEAAEAFAQHGLLAEVKASVKTTKKTTTAEAVQTP